MTTEERKLSWPDTLNTRDLGGYPTKNGRTVTWGRLIRSDNLARLSAEGQNALVKYGVRTIIDLRFSKELKTNPSPFTNIRSDSEEPLYRHLSLIPEHITNSAPLKWGTQAERYCAALEHFQPQIAVIIKTIANASAGATLFCCHAGKDRTGIIAGLLLSLLGVSAEDVAADYADSATHLEPWVAQRRMELGDDSKAQLALTWDMAAESETMLEMVKFIDQAYKGIEAYMLECGVTSEEIREIRERLLT